MSAVAAKHATDIHQPVCRSFTEVAGVAGGAVTSSALYRGLARLLGLRRADVPSRADLAAEMAERVAAAEALIAEGARFVHVHTKATDEAGGAKLSVFARPRFNVYDWGVNQKRLDRWLGELDQTLRG